MKYSDLIQQAFGTPSMESEDVNMKLTETSPVRETEPGLAEQSECEIQLITSNDSVDELSKLSIALESAGYPTHFIHPSLYTSESSNGSDGVTTVDRSGINPAGRAGSAPKKTFRVVRLVRPEDVIPRPEEVKDEAVYLAESDDDVVAASAVLLSQEGYTVVRNPEDVLKWLKS